MSRGENLDGGDDPREIQPRPFEEDEENLLRTSASHGFAK